MRQEKGRGHGPDYLTPPPLVQCGILQVSEGGTIFMPFSVKTNKQTRGTERFGNFQLCLREKLRLLTQGNRSHAGF